MGRGAPPAASLPRARGRPRHGCGPRAGGGWARLLLLLLLLPLAAASGGGAFTCRADRDAATCAALGDLFASSGGVMWHARDGWASAAAGAAADFCAFAGVSCDGATLAVTALCVAAPPAAHARAPGAPRRAGD
jgi:hypothetical protein